MPSISVDFALISPLSSSVVFGALTDFSDKRVTYFPNLSRSHFRVLERKETSALVEEGAGPFLTTERYDWSSQGRVWSVIEKSSVFAPGGMTDVKIATRSDGGSLLQIHVEREFVGWKGAVLFASAILNGRRRFFRRTYRRMLSTLARDSHKKR